MRTYSVLNILFVWVIVSIMTPVTLSAIERLFEDVSYALIPSCNASDIKKAAPDGKFYLSLEITSIADEYEDFQIYLNGVPQAQFHVERSELPKTRSIGPFDHTGVGGTYYEYIVESLNSGISDTLYTRELACGVASSNGVNRAGYYCSRDNIGVIAQTAPEALYAPSIPDKTYVYVLLTRNDKIVRGKNFSGRFDGVEDLAEYEIHAYATSFERSVELVNGIIIGEQLDQSDIDVCYGLCGVFPVRTDCTSFDMSLKKQLVGDFIVQIGDTVRFDIIIKNEGLVPSYNTVVKESPPQGLLFLKTLSPLWNEDLTSQTIPEILPGATVTLPIYFYIKEGASGITAENIAEILFSGINTTTDVNAFDTDSEPDNADPSEDDRDTEALLILDNFCSESFEFEMDHEPICEGVTIKMSARVIKASPPLEYLWRFDGDFISKEPELIIENHGVANYGMYSLTIVDSMGCSGTEFFNLLPIQNSQIITCYSELDIGVGVDCALRLSPDMLTRQPVSAINDYILEIQTLDGRPVDINDLSNLEDIDKIEVRLINPCTGDTKCWTHIHIHYDYVPQFQIYDSVFVTHCNYRLDGSATSIIDQYNTTSEDPILSGELFADSLNRLSCVTSYEVFKRDQFVEDPEMCGVNSIRRIYQTRIGGDLVDLDTAVLVIEQLGANQIFFPKDVDNIPCNSAILPLDISSYPYYVYRGDTIEISGSELEDKGLVFCTVGITYNDQFHSSLCLSGTSKVIRTWTSLDWCTNQVKTDIQFLYTRDLDAPIISLIQDTITVTINDENCTASIDLFPYVTVEDYCDPSPGFFVQSASESKNFTISDLGLGLHQFEIYALDKCGNRGLENIWIEVVDSTAPVMIINETISITIQEGASLGMGRVLASAFNSGSHDHGCGPVDIEISRKYWLDLYNQGPIKATQDLAICDTKWKDLDINNSGFIEREELFRPFLEICCDEIGQGVRVVLKGTDINGNISEVEALLSVVTKDRITACDDGDKCTINDQQVGDCPCAGTPNYSDLDLNQIPDCQQDMMIICVAGVTLEVQPESFEDFIQNGATAGECLSDEPLAIIAGAIFNAEGLFVQNVSVNSINNGYQMTNGEGSYAFSHLPMYTRYELTPLKNDDPLNGVTALDLVLIKQHILGLDQIIDPYQLIAADANGDGKITTLDIVEIRKLLLGIYSEFPNNLSWRFILEKFEFEDIKNPFPWSETNVISSLEKDMMDENWIGVKIGDVSNSAVANSTLAKKRSKNSEQLFIEKKAYLKGEKVAIDLALSDINSVRATQFKLFFRGLKIDGVKSANVSLGSSDYHIIETEKGSYLTVVWYDEKKNSESAFSINVSGRAMSNISLQQDIYLDHRYFSVSYDKVFDEYNLGLTFTDSNDLSHNEKIKLYQNQPNPFTGKTMIQFELPAAGEVELIIYSASGERIYVHNGVFHNGVNAVSIDRDDLINSSGVLYYQIIFEGQRLTKSMVNAQN